MPIEQQHSTKNKKKESTLTLEYKRNVGVILTYFLHFKTFFVTLRTAGRWSFDFIIIYIHRSHLETITLTILLYKLIK